MRVRRDVNSIPHRSATDTWKKIVGLITSDKSVDRGQLDKAEGVVTSLITDEFAAQKPIIVEGVGSQLRIYCRFGISAIEDGTEASPLSWCPTAGDWTMRVPCDAENLSWVRESLSKTSPRITAFDISKADDEEADSQTSEAAIQVNWNL